MSNLAPIVLFVYNRPWHTEQTLEALMQNELADQSILYIMADGAKENATSEQLQKIKEVRQVIRKKQWCKEVHIEEKEKNWGLADSIVDGVTRIVNQYGKIIVLEDDIVTSIYFLKYENEGLEMYEENKNIYSINGYMFPIDTYIEDTFLCPLAVSSWGWATWADRWESYQTNILEKDIIIHNPFILNRFNFGGYNYAALMDNTNSWAIRWYYSVFLKNGLGLFTSKSLVKNIGFDGSGTHGGSSNKLQETLSKPMVLRKKNMIDLRLYSVLLNYFATQYTTTNTQIYTQISKMITVKQVLRAIMPPILYDGLASIKARLSSNEEEIAKNIVVQNTMLQSEQRILYPEAQELNIYWDENMAEILETWGENHVWNEIQLLLCNCQGKVLDVACGTGTVIQFLQKYSQLDVFGCDISDLLIQRAMNKGIPKEKLIICDATKMDMYKNDFFDYSYSIGSLEHFTEQGIIDFVRENHRIVQKKGFHQIPVSLSNENEGWITPYQSYFNNSVEWWLEKFRTSYQDVKMVKSGWKDEKSIGMWFICNKTVDRND